MDNSLTHEGAMTILVDVERNHDDVCVVNDQHSAVTAGGLIAVTPRPIQERLPFSTTSSRAALEVPTKVATATTAILK